MGLLLIKTEDVYIAVDFLYEPKIKLLVLGEAKTGIVPNSCLEMFFASSLSLFFFLSNTFKYDTRRPATLSTCLANALT